MKPFTTQRNQMNNFELDLEGFGDASLLDVFGGTSIESLAVPIGHSLTTAWLVLLSLKSGVLVELCSLCNDLGDWQEVGSLKLRLIAGKVHDVPNVEWISSNVHNFIVDKVDKVEYCESSFRTECGLCFVSSNNEELWIVAGPAPGSVSVKLPDSCEDFVTEFPIDEYIRTELTA